MAGNLQSPPDMHYDVVIDGGAIMGPHPDVENFNFLNGFSGHGPHRAWHTDHRNSSDLTFGDIK
ncbi:hypothetical protein [Tateyamaria pelophila]|uniref:hypothetical protein n=1 Tax=Tateyamaria pelophila TaxID=328415 RepID=UPI001CBCC45A|nr:hypothetical protein [Tateyamaria pelophila]